MAKNVFESMSQCTYHGPSKIVKVLMHRAYVCDTKDRNRISFRTSLVSGLPAAHSFNGPQHLSQSHLSLLLMLAITLLSRSKIERL